MKKFPYKFTTFLKCMFSLGILLAISVIVLNIFKFAKSEVVDSYSYITLICTVVVAIFTIVLILSIVFYSRFIIDDTTLTIRWGLIKHQFKIVSITKLVKLDASNKIILYYNSDNFMYVYINSEIFDEFSKELVSKNKDIIIEYTNG